MGVLTFWILGRSLSAALVIVQMTSTTVHRARRRLRIRSTHAAFSSQSACSFSICPCSVSSADVLGLCSERSETDRERRQLVWQFQPARHELDRCGTYASSSHGGPAEENPPWGKSSARWRSPHHSRWHFRYRLAHGLCRPTSSRFRSRRSMLLGAQLSVSLDPRGSGRLKDSTTRSLPAGLRTCVPRGSVTSGGCCIASRKTQRPSGLNALLRTTIDPRKEISDGDEEDEIIQIRGGAPARSLVQI